MGEEVIQNRLYVQRTSNHAWISHVKQRIKSGSPGILSVCLSCRKLEGVDLVNLMGQRHMQMCLSYSWDIESGLIEMGFLVLPYN